MPDAGAFLRDAADRGVRFFLDGGKLKSSGTEALTPAEVDYVRRGKAEVIAHLLPSTNTVGSGVGNDRVPLSYQQERLWLLHEIAERSEEYNSVTLLAVRGRFDPARFGAALCRVVADNDALRTVFRADGDVVRQVVLDTRPWIGQVPADSPESAYRTARSLERAEADHQFDLSNEIPVRCRVVSTPGDLHYVVLNIHHIACDGWSMSLILDRISAYYDDPDALPPATGRSYREYSQWQRDTLTGDVLDSMVGQWCARLDGAPLTHGLPADFAPGHAARAGVVRQRIGHRAYAAFRDACLADGAGEFAGLHAVLAILLAGVSGVPETVVGSPIANREQPDIHDTVGFFVNMISVRGAVHADSTFRDVLAAKLAEIEFGYTFQQAPFEKVVERLTGRRERNSTPIFQIVLALQNNRVVTPRFGSAVADELPEAHRHNRFALEIFVHGSGPADRELEWVYDAALFEPATVQRWASWFAALLEEVTERPGTPVARLRALAPGTASDATRPEPATVDVLRRINAVAAADPGRIAVSDGTTSETYADLVAHAGRIGAALSEVYGPDAVFAVGMDRSVDLVRTLVAVMSIGAAYVVLDPEDTPARRAAVVEASGPCCLLVAGEHTGEDTGLDPVDVRTLTPRTATLPVASADPERDLYHVFTSGSTGRPKGVRITYGNLATYLGGVIPRLRLTEGAGFCWHSSVATDFGNTVIFGALATGGRLEIATRDDILDGAAMSAFLRDRGIGVLKITPSHLEALLETHPITELLPARTLVLGGEAASRAVVRALREVPAPIDVFNHYGPSETTVGVFVADLRDRTDARVFPIGHPLPGVEFTVEAPDGRAVPFGAAGELVLRGPQVSPGYLAQPSGPPTPFFATPTWHGYRTGDLVRVRNDGAVVFLGRLDSQVKIRGYRVELGEIKAALESVPGVARAEVLLDPRENAPAEVVAFVQPDGMDSTEGPADVAATVEQWREFYDYAYSERVSGDIEFNTSGWISSYTGEKIPDAQMREWLSLILGRISALRPKNVLEIGCGLGIIAYPLSRSVDSYLACDFSSEIIAANTANARTIDTGRLSFFVCEALDIDRHADRIRAAGVDTVIINSVVQYFPDARYLDAVLDKVLAIDCVRTVFVGDVRNYDLLDEFSLSLVDFRDGGSSPGLERLRLAQAESGNVTELLVSDLYWSEFAKRRECLAGVSVLPRISEFSNELLDFRYDVVLTKDVGTLHTAGERGVLTVEAADLEHVGTFIADLTDGVLDTIVVRGVHNGQTAAHCHGLRSARSGVAGTAGSAPGPDQTFARLLDLAARRRLRVSAHYARDEHGQLSRLDVALFLDGSSGIADSRRFGRIPDGRHRALVNTPASAGPRTTLADRVGEQVTRALPRHMRPDRIVEVPAFPLNRTGKIDLRTLRTLIPRHELAAVGELTGETETRLAGIVAGLLGAGKSIDRETDFFEAGGHSLLATRYVHAVNQAFGTDLRVKSVFQRPKLRDFAELVDNVAGRAPQQPAPAAGAVTISPLQQRFWTMEQVSGPSTVYNSMLLLELTGPLSVGGMRAAFADVIAHHRVLRGYFHADGDRVWHRQRERDDFALAHLDVPGLDQAGAERILRDRLARPFDLETGPLLDAALLSAAPDRHFLAMAIHHAIFDGASEEILVADLQESYAAHVEGRERRWTDSGDGFFAHLARARPATPESIEFWVRHLAGAPALHALPLDHDRPVRASVVGASVHTMLTADTTALLADLARRHRTTMFVVLNAFVALYTSFLSGQDDVVIGSPVDCRATESDATAVGMYVNTVAIRHRLDWSRALDDLITEARDFFRDAVAHLAVPFDRLVEELNPPRIPGVNPVFQIMLALQPEGAEVFAFHGLTARSIKVGTVRSKFDLTLNSKVVDGRLHVYWEYDRALFTAARIERMSAFFEPFTHTVASAPDRPLAGHRFGTAAGAVLTGPEVPLTDESYLDAFARTVATRSDEPAVRTSRGEVWDYRGLDERSDALATLLHDKGVGAGDLVAITLERSAESLVAALAINKVGAAYVPMDSEYLRHNASGLMADHGIGFAVVEDGEADFGAATTVSRREIPTSGGFDAFAGATVRGSDLCYVIFTSGSTGRPKGVAVTHRSVVNYLAHCSATYLEHRPETAVVASPLSFDATVTTTLFGLAAGLTLHIVTEGGELDGLRRELTKGGRLLLKLTPSHLVALANLGVTRDVRSDRHTFVIGGEELRASAISPWYQAFPQASFFNEYGPTEATVGCLIHRVRAGDTERGSVPIGTPICNTTIAVLDRGNVCLADQRGELVILGEGLARGYLDPAQTREAFRAQPALDGRIGYHSGDLASLAGSGLRYHGRRTREIKVRGFRVSIPEIEAAIGDIEEVADCACAVSADGARLLAYVVLDGSRPRTREVEAWLRDTVRASLPSYMVPDSIRLLTELPLTPNGKVDLERLGRQTPPAEVTAGATVNRRLHAIWQEVLATSGELPADVSFFALGGNSLSVTHLLRRINEEFDTDLRFEALYREVTLERQAALLAGSSHHAGPNPARAGARDEVELTPAQRRIFLMEKLGSGAEYVNSICFRFGAGVDDEHLRAALLALVDRHPILACRVAERGEELLLLPGASADPDPVTPCRDEDEVLERMSRARDASVNVFGGPLFRAARYLLPDGSLRLQLLVHHIIFDGWSERVLLDDLAMLYGRIVGGEPVPATRPAPFQEYAAGEREAAATDWWIAALSGAPAAHSLPVRERARTEEAARVHRVISGDTLAGIDREARRLGATAFSIVHSALALAVCNLSYDNDIVIGVPTANRGDRHFHGTVGLFMETLPLRTVIPGRDTTFEQLVLANRATLTDALGRTDFQMDAVLNACAPQRDGTRNPLYQIMLSYNDEGGETLMLGGAMAERFHLPARAPKLDLIVDAKMIDGALHLYWEYDTGLFSARLITALVGHFESWLRWGLARPASALGEFTLPQEHPPVPAPARRRSAYERFASAWADRWQDIAYTEEGTRLTAGQLRGRVAAMAERLAAAGLGRKSVVACASRGVLDHVITLLACSRMGAVHVPLDMSSPPGRIAAILDVCDADVVVAERPDYPGYPTVSTAGLREDGPVPPATPGSAAAISHVMFTSGSTGTPKGVRISNGSLDSYVTGINAAYGITGAPVAQCGNPAYDVFIEEIGLSILVGNRMAVLPHELRAQPSAFARFVERERIELLPLPTSYWAFLVGAMSEADFDRLRHVRVCAVGGEDYPVSAAQTWLRTFAGGPRLFNVYGPTENGPVSLVAELHPDTPPSTMGAPLGEVRCTVRSRFAASVPVEGRGELWLSGPQLFSGYVGGPAVAEYPTGDVVLVDGEHGYRFVQRAGAMMKLSGFRVELGEYAAALEDVPGVEDVRVTPNAEATGVIIYAKLTGPAGEDEVSATIGQRLRASLPGYMCRYELRFCEEIPLTPNGKADFRALRELSRPAPEPVAAGRSNAAGPVASLVSDLKLIWQRVLATNQIDEERGFFDNGGTSMSMLRLLALLNEQFPNCFELIDLYEKSSIELQAWHIHERGSATRTEPTARERLAEKRRSRRRTGSAK